MDAKLRWQEIDRQLSEIAMRLVELRGKNQLVIIAARKANQHVREALENARLSELEVLMQANVLRKERSTLFKAWETIGIPKYSSGEKFYFAYLKRKNELTRKQIELSAVQTALGTKIFRMEKALQVPDYTAQVTAEFQMIDVTDQITILEMAYSQISISKPYNPYSLGTWLQNLWRRFI